jgi:serine/threonine protein phosphatase PrpC
MNSVKDSRAIMCRKGRVEELSYDHKPNRKDEKQRIVELGGSSAVCAFARCVASMLDQIACIQED